MKHYLRVGFAAVAALCLLVSAATAQFASQAQFVGTAGGTANAPTVTVPNIGAYADIKGVPITFQVGTANTGAVTLNANSLGAKSVVYSDGSAVLAGDFAPAGATVTVLYDGTNFQVQTITLSGIKSHALLRTRTKITATGAYTFTVPANVYTVTVTAWGGGAGGGGSNNASGAGGGGGGGQIVQNIAVVPGTTITGSVGTGGSAGVSGGGAAPTSGGNTTFVYNSITWTAGGGVNASNSSAGTAGNSAAGGSNSVSSGAIDIDRPGEPSAGALQGYSGSAILYYGGKGGNSPNGGYGGQAGTGSPNPGATPGGGGGGAASNGGNTNGAVGARGEVWIDQ